MQRNVCKTVFFFLCLFALPLSAGEKYYLSICAIFRNEERFLKEWIEYHRMIGVDHFYLLNNLSVDHYLDILSPYIESGVVDLIQWPFESKEEKNWTKIQCGAYNYVVKMKKKETYWLAVIDTDEFIVVKTGQDLKDFLRGYKSFGGLGINWQLFGTSYVERILEDSTLIGTLTQRAPEDYYRNKFMKTIFRTKKFEKMSQPHFCYYKKDAFHVTENKERIHRKTSLTDVVSVDKIQINHYTYRDEEFFYHEKVSRYQQWQPGGSYGQDPNLNLIEDTFMLKYVLELERRLFQTKN